MGDIALHAFLGVCGVALVVQLSLPIWAPLWIAYQEVYLDE